MQNHSPHPRHTKIRISTKKTPGDFSVCFPVWTRKMILSDLRIHLVKKKSTEQNGTESELYFMEEKNQQISFKT